MVLSIRVLFVENNMVDKVSYLHIQKRQSNISINWNCVCGKLTHPTFILTLALYWAPPTLEKNICYNLHIIHQLITNFVYVLFWQVAYNEFIRAFEENSWKQVDESSENEPNKQSCGL